jgi:hypothetical protein
VSERVLVTSADVWELTDEKTGEFKQGLSIWYLNEYRTDTSSSFGFKPTKVSAVRELIGQVQNKLPGFFDMEFGSRPGEHGKATLTLTGLKFVKPVDLFSSISSSSKV